MIILLPLPFDNTGKSCAGKINILPADVIATTSAVEFINVLGFNTLAFSGKEIKAFPALLRAIKSSNLQINHILHQKPSIILAVRWPLQHIQWSHQWVN